MALALGLADSLEAVPPTLACGAPWAHVRGRCHCRTGLPGQRPDCVARLRALQHAVERCQAGPDTRLTSGAATSPELALDRLACAALDVELRIHRVAQGDAERALRGLRRCAPRLRELACRLRETIGGVGWSKGGAL